MHGSSFELLERVRNLSGVLSVKYRAGELIFPEGGFAAGVYLVRQGLVGLFCPCGSRNLCVYVAGPGELFGLEAWFKTARPQYRVAGRALTEADLFFLPSGLWEKAGEDREFRELVFSALAQMWLSLWEREARKTEAPAALLWAFQRWGEETPEGIRLSLSPHVLAMALGLSRGALKRAMVHLGVSQREDRLILKRERLLEAHALTRSPQ